MARRRKRVNQYSDKLDHSIRSNQVNNDSVQFSVLSKTQCERIFNGVLEVLEHVGVDIHHKEAVELLRKAGCWVENDGIRVKIPSYVVKQAISTAPSRIVLSDRNKKRTMFMEGNNSYFGPGPTNLNFIDVYTGERRPVTKNDVFNTAKVVDALPNMDYCMSLANITDCTPQLADVHEIHAMLQNTEKPICAWSFDLENLKTIIKMFEAVAGGAEELQKNPNIIFYSEPTTPMVHTKEAVDKLLYMAEKRLPQLYTPAVQAGATGPATRAGTLIINTVDTLTGLVIAQVKSPGAPCVCGGVITNMDMKTTACCYGSSPEFTLMHAAAVELIRYLGIPTWSTAGCSDAKIVDEQVSIEEAITIFGAALSGANIIHDVGFLNSGLCGSLEGVVMGDEIIGMVRSIMRGVRVDDESLALDVIEKVGPGGHFLAEEHTMKNFRREFWQPVCMSRENYEKWLKDGKLTYKQKVNMRARKILETHNPQKLPDDIVAKLDELVAKAEIKYKK
ncbi:trimethylamine methyltransferase family protein [Maledivibacter halophilus]|uniref:Trimethylamine---corrinoid protein Co-methyltransferase n=1 Tax=Maledivibacter halophilus TaxID=36842 RepID=A0A1T5I9L4_9FIRM|nr:trimethylamine methyltransferase family protein [Maledivibacter halophilus]SKC35861.1 trimethylamine---corrinoid protein Co-methyltransferase [Maledivibacter halophilus]